MDAAWEMFGLRLLDTADMEFHDVLHGHIRFKNGDELTRLLSELINSPEINRLRNMRQMNFDVPLIQELGRSRRLPHSIGVAHIALELALRAGLSFGECQILLAASIMHDAAIPPYGHLVESEFKNLGVGFKHETRVAELIRGVVNNNNQYLEIFPKKALQVLNILHRFGIEPDAVIEAICPSKGRKSPISADIDLDNIDNVHRMAVMLGWPGAAENLRSIKAEVSLNGLGEMSFSSRSIPSLERWLDFRQRIYTMIIAHPECIPYNALQTDLVRMAIKDKIISPDDWYLSEPEFEEELRRRDGTKALAYQLLSGCEYQTIDYVWMKNFQSKVKLNNAQIDACLIREIDIPADHGYFIWNEKGLVSREVKVNGHGWVGQTVGFNSTSCMIALVKKTAGRPKWTKTMSSKWRRDTVAKFSEIFQTHQFEIDFPETYTGKFLGNKTNEIQIGYY